MIYSLDRYQIAYIVMFQTPSDPEPLDAVSGVNVEEPVSEQTQSDAVGKVTAPESWSLALLTPG